MQSPSKCMVAETYKNILILTLASQQWYGVDIMTVIGSL